jgi:hypothetical protein
MFAMMRPELGFPRAVSLFEFGESLFKRDRLFEFFQVDERFHEGAQRIHVSRLVSNDFFEARDGAAQEPARLKILPQLTQNLDAFPRLEITA